MSDAPCFTFDLALGIPPLPIFQLNLPDIALVLPNLDVGGIAVVPCCKFAFNLNITLPTLGLPLSVIATAINADIYAAETVYNALVAGIGLQVGVAIPTCNQIAEAVL
jgi:hypothetical protein